MIKLRWIASISCQNEQKCWVTSQTIQNTRKTTKVIKFTMNCIDLTSKRSKMFSYVPNHSKQRKSTKVIKLQWIASIWCQNDKKCLVTSQTIQNTAKLQKWSNLRWIASIWRQNDKKMLSYVPNHSKQQRKYKSYQNTMNCIDLMSKR